MAIRPTLSLLFAPLVVAAAAAAQGVEPPPGGAHPQFDKATADYRAGRFAECENGFRAVSRVTGRAGLAARAAYAAACCAAQRGALEAAFSELQLALAFGFRDVERALTDDRLAPLRADKRWMEFLKKAEGQDQAHELALDSTLLGFWKELESERLKGTVQPGRPEERRRETLARVDQGKLRQPEDYFHAAALLADSDRPDEVARARSLAHRALVLDPDLLAARPLFAQALDREQVLAGNPQKFGTQVVLEGGRWELYPLDPAVTDADRAAWGVPPLAELRARRETLATPAPPSR